MAEPDKKKLPDDEFEIIDLRTPKPLLGPRIEIIQANQLPPELAAIIMEKAMQSEEGVWALYDLLHDGGYEKLVKVLMDKSESNKENNEEFVHRISKIGSGIIDNFMKKNKNLTLGEMELILLSVIKMLYKMHGTVKDNHNKCDTCPMKELCKGLGK
jgi:hypothetical protein